MRWLLWMAIAAAGCRVGDRPAATEDAGAGDEGPVTLSVADLDRAELTYATLEGRFRRAQGLTAVPVMARGMVRVTWPTAARAQTRDDDRVHVVDLSRPNADGSYTTERVRELAFESRALAKLPPGDASRIDWRGGGPAATLVSHEDIVVYGTAWCGACKRVRVYLDAHLGGGDAGGASHRYFEVGDQGDPAAIDRLGRLGAALGVDLDRVPVIDVRGRVLVGFDERRLATLLGVPL